MTNLGRVCSVVVATFLVGAVAVSAEGGSKFGHFPARWHEFWQSGPAAGKAEAGVAADVLPSQLGVPSGRGDYHSLMEHWFSEFLQASGKAYPDPVERQRRLAVFARELEEVMSHNDANASAPSYTVGINSLSDLEEEEMVPRTHCSDVSGELGGQGAEAEAAPEPEAPKPRPEHAADANGANGKYGCYGDVESDCDWRQYGFVNKPADQGHCGSCWSFAVTAVVESMHAIWHAPLRKLSEQEVMDCLAGSPPGSHAGCTGFSPRQALTDISAAGHQGLVLDSMYPYKAANQTCDTAHSKSVASVANACAPTTPVKKGDEAELRKQVSTYGPMAVTINASPTSFKRYTGGVYDDDECDDSKHTHAVVVVGFGTDSETGKKYFTVRNSWGDGYGDGGYVKMAAGKNLCGITDYVLGMSSC